DEPVEFAAERIGLGLRQTEQPAEPQPGVAPGKRPTTVGKADPEPGMVGQDPAEDERRASQGGVGHHADPERLQRPGAPVDAGPVDGVYEDAGAEVGSGGEERP